MMERKKLPLWLVFTLDVFAAALLIGGWFVARIVTDTVDEPEPIAVASVRTTPEPVPTPAPALLPAGEAESEPEPEEPDGRSEWQIRFAEHFTPEVVSAEDHYSSPNLSITVSHHDMETDKGPVVYHLADIYIGSIDCFRSALAATPPRFHMSASLLDMLAQHDGVLGVNGDFCSFSYGGVSVRNGVIWSSSRGTVDLCALYRDGTMETFSPRAFDLDAAIERDVWQVWSFGPQLLNPDGSPYEIPYSALPDIHISGRNPRTAIGYYEPGHYCFLVADGRQIGYSVGMTLDEMSALFSELGCRCAFNLDGGGSSMMAFRGELVSQIYSDVPRNLSDCVLIADIAPETDGGKEARP